MKQTNLSNFFGNNKKRDRNQFEDAVPKTEEKVEKVEVTNELLIEEKISPVRKRLRKLEPKSESVFSDPSEDEEISESEVKVKEEVVFTSMEVKSKDIKDINDFFKKKPPKQEKKKSVFDEDYVEVEAIDSKNTDDDDFFEKEATKKSEKIEKQITVPKREYKREKSPPKTSGTTQVSTKQAEKYRQSKYKPKPHELIQPGSVPYLAVARTLASIEQTTKRLEITERFSQLLRSVIAISPSSLLQVIYLCINQLAPAYLGIELGIGESLLMKAIAESTGATVKGIKSLYLKKGDLGTVAHECRSSQKTMFKPTPLTVEKVFKTFLEIATFKGHSSTQQKVAKIKSLLVACTETEAIYIVRSLQGKLRCGLAGQTILVGIAHAFELTPPRPIGFPKKSDKEEDNVLSLDTTFDSSEVDLQARLLSADAKVKQVYYQLPNFEMIIPHLLEGKLATITDICKLTPGIPLKPMLAYPTKGVGEVLTKFENQRFTCEYKYDGERAQIHLTEEGKISIYSRNSENNTTKYPDILELLPNAAKEHIKSYVIDCEAVAYDREQQKILPFQVLSTRGKKEVKMEDIKVQICLYVFDILYLNGVSYMTEPLETRRKVLYDSFNVIPTKFVFANHMESNNTEEIEEYLNKSIEDLCEGLMVKTLEGTESSYEPSKRSKRWLKLKKDYLDDIGDSLDLVPIGGYRGRGKRTGVYGGFLLACYDKDNEEFQSICKIGTGFSDENLATFAKFFADKELATAPPYYLVPEKDLPDVWFEPHQVWEVKAADLSISPTHKAALGVLDPNKGISLRFPRFIRIRDDKNTEDATDFEQVVEMYKSQTNKKSDTNDAFDDEDW